MRNCKHIPYIVNTFIGVFSIVEIDTTGWASGTYGIHHKAKDQYGGESTWEDILIIIN